MAWSKSVACPTPATRRLTAREIAIDQTHPQPSPPRDARRADEVLFEHHEFMRRLFEKIETMSPDDPERRDLMRLFEREDEVVLRINLPRLRHVRVLPDAFATLHRRLDAHPACGRDAARMLYFRNGTGMPKKSASRTKFSPSTAHAPRVARMRSSGPMWKSPMTSRLDEK